MGCSGMTASPTAQVDTSGNNVFYQSCKKDVAADSPYRRAPKEMACRSDRVCIISLVPFADDWSPHMDYVPTRWPYSPRIVLRCTPRASNGPNHLGLCAVQRDRGGRAAGTVQVNVHVPAVVLGCAFPRVFPLRLQCL